MNPTSTQPPPPRSPPDRAFALALVCAIASLAGCSHSPSESSSPAPSNRTRDLIDDDRISYLLAPCPKSEAFLADTSDMIPVLVSKLAYGQLDPLKEAKAELADLGEAALPELRRFVERWFSDPQGGNRLLNALPVVGLMKSDGGRDILLRALEHVEETVRLAAVRGLERHPRQDDYERLSGWLPVSSAEAQGQIAQALFACDRDRLEDDFARWFEDKKYPATWNSVLPRICDTQRAATLEHFARFAKDARGEMRVYMQAALARSGDEAALAEMRALLADQDPSRRTIAARTLERAGLSRELAAQMRSESDDAIRQAAAAAIAGLPPSKENDALLSAGLSDRARGVREVCLSALVKRGDPAARDAALELLKGEKADLEGGLRALREVWRDDPALAARALDILVRLHSGELQPVRVELHALERAIALVPLVQATQRLYELARISTGTIQDLPAHRWYLQQAGNTGPAGAAFLREQWDREEDSVRRTDILTACTYDKDESSRAFLIRVIESERATPCEILYAADLFVHRGPASRAAPVLKRRTLGLSDPKVRPAMNCLLWRWYGLDV